LAAGAHSAARRFRLRARGADGLCEANGVHFLFGLAKTDRLIAEIKAELEGAAAQSRRTGKPARRIILKTASEAFISSHARPKILPANQVIGTKDGVSLEGVKLGVRSEQALDGDPPIRGAAIESRAGAALLPDRRVTPFRALPWQNLKKLNDRRVTG
jgi:hypothetical protein